GGHGGSLALEFVPAPDPLYSCGSTLGRGGRAGRRQPPAKRLQGQNLCPGFESRPLRHGPLAQVDRASDYESEGQRFESSRAHHPHSIPEGQGRATGFLSLARPWPLFGGLGRKGVLPKTATLQGFDFRNRPKPAWYRSCCLESS